MERRRRFSNPNNKPMRSAPYSKSNQVEGWRGGSKIYVIAFCAKLPKVGIKTSGCSGSSLTASLVTIEATRNRPNLWNNQSHP